MATKMTKFPVLIWTHGHTLLQSCFVAIKNFNIVVVVVFVVVVVVVVVVAAAVVAPVGVMLTVTGT